MSVTDINLISIEDLQAELDRRNEQAKKDSIPKLIDNPDLTLLKKTVEENMQSILEGDRREDRYESYIYQEAMVAYYGKLFFDWKDDYVAD